MVARNVRPRLFTPFSGVDAALDLVQQQPQQPQQQQQLQQQALAVVSQQKVVINYMYSFSMSEFQRTGLPHVTRHHKHETY